MHSMDGCLQAITGFEFNCATASQGANTYYI